MFGIKKKTATKVSYPETFHFDPGTMTVIYTEVFEILEKRARAGKRDYKGRFVDEWHMHIELEEFKGVTLPYSYFSPKDAYGM